MLWQTLQVKGRRGNWHALQFNKSGTFPGKGKKSPKGQNKLTLGNTKFPVMTVHRQIQRKQGLDFSNR